MGFPLDGSILMGPASICGMLASAPRISRLTWTDFNSVPPPGLGTSKVQFAVVLATPDDEGYARGKADVNRPGIPGGSSIAPTRFWIPQADVAVARLSSVPP